MKIDIHCHALGNSMDINNIEKDIYFNVEDNPHWLTSILYDMIEKDLKKNGADFNRDVMIKRAHGFSDSILENAEKEKVLHTPVT